LNGNCEPSKRKINIYLSNDTDISSSTIKQQANQYKKIKLLNNKLIEAIKRNQMLECRSLIAAGANLHMLNTTDLYLYSIKMFSALHFSGWYGGALLIQMFVDLGINPDIRNRDNDTPLHLAAWEDNNLAIKKLLDLGASIEATNNEGTTPIMWSASNGKPAAISLIASQGANINARDFQGNTAIHWAAFKGHSEAVALLYKHGSYLDIKNHHGKLPLDVAIANGQTEAVDKILQILGKV
jgi:ankyrin repeat protein